VAVVVVAAAVAGRLAAGHPIHRPPLRDRRLYSWSRTAGKHLLMDYLGSQTMQTQGTAYLRTGWTGALYRVTMP
jgi:hypothetical protein